MSDNIYVLECLVRIRMEELQAAAAREHLLAALPPRPTSGARALGVLLGRLRSGLTRGPRPSSVRPLWQ